MSSVKKVFSRRKKHSGIYLLKIKDSYYIGQSVDIFSRWNTHLTQLFAETHHNKHLVELFNSNSYRDIEFSILKLCKKSELNKLEKEYIISYRNEGKNVINILLNKSLLDK